MVFKNRLDGKAENSSDNPSTPEVPLKAKVDGTGKPLFELFSYIFQAETIDCVTCECWWLGGGRVQLPCEILFISLHNFHKSKLYDLLLIYFYIYFARYRGLPFLSFIDGMYFFVLYFKNSQHNVCWLTCRQLVRAHCQGTTLLSDDRYPSPIDSWIL